MRKAVLALILMPLVFTLSGAFGAAEQETLTIRGEVVDNSCYRKLGVEKGTGAAHLSCALDCAKKGQVLAILTDGDGLLKMIGDYVANNNAKLIDYVGKYVEVSGTRDRFTDYSAAIKVTKITAVKKPE